MSENILDVMETTFESEVIQFSMEKPVLVDFWAPWCQPCRILGPVLERLSEELDGSFRLAKVNVDENPGLAGRYGIQGIPAVKVFHEGKIVSQFTGVQPEAYIRKLLTGLTPSPAAQLVLEATGLLVARHWNQAETAAKRALDADPKSGKAALCLVKALLAQGKGLEALDRLEHFPADDEITSAEKLKPLADFVAEMQSSRDQPLDDLEAEYLQAARLITTGNFPAALDGLLDILRHNKHYREDNARKVFLAILEILGEDDPQTREYRNELASVLF